MYACVALNSYITCNVKNHTMSCVNIFVSIYAVPAPPNVTISPSDPIQGAMVGSSQVITCTAVTPTLLDVVFDWVGPRGTITTDSRVTISPIISNGTTYTSSLQFTHLMEGDEGNYTCTVSLFSAMSVTASDYVEILNLTGMFMSISYKYDITCCTITSSTKFNYLHTQANICFSNISLHYSPYA